MFHIVDNIEFVQFTLRTIKQAFGSKYTKTQAITLPTFHRLQQLLFTIDFVGDVYE